MNTEKTMELREIMKSFTQSDPSKHIPTDQESGLPQPPIDRVRGGTPLIPLTKEFSQLLRTDSFLSILNSRVSRRTYSDEPLSLSELAFLLWSTQGVKVVGKTRRATLRTIPSGGARHALECYLFVNRVEGLTPGLYHYLALDHTLEFMGSPAHQSETLTEVLGGQTFAGNAPVCFIYTAIPNRMEWRYENAQKYTLIEAGHACQNLYLACEAVGLGTCAIGEYHQAELDTLLGLDSAPSASPENEFSVYVACVGKPKTE
jgi:SagB-type dehydrogenase family enzyme